MLQEVFNFLDSKKQAENTDYTAKINVLKEYFKDFFLKYPQKNIQKISTISDKEVMVALIILSNPLKLQEIVDVLEKYPEIFRNGEYTELFASLTLYYDNEYIQDLVEACLCSNPFINIPATIKFKQALLTVGIPPQKGDIIEFIKKHPKVIKDLAVIFEHYTYEFHNHGTYLIEAIRRFHITEEFDYEKAFLSTLSREEKRQYKKVIGIDQHGKILFLEKIGEYYNFLNAKLDEIIKEYEKSERDRRSVNKNLNELKKLLDSNEEIKNIDAILKLCPTKEIKEYVVNYIIEHNKTIYLALISTYERAKLNSDENLNNLFNNYGFDYTILNKEDKEKIKQISFDDIEILLKRLSVLKVFRINVARVNLFKLSVVEELRGKGIITEEWLQENENLLLDDNNELDVVVTNIDMLSKEGINMIQYSNSLEITKSPLLKHNLHLLRLYNLAITKTTTNIKFLMVSDLRLRIEFMYSLGLHPELVDLNILNNSLEELLKIKIANSLNIPVESIVDLSEVFIDFAQDYIPEETLRKLSEDSLFITDIPICLKAYHNDNQTLNINGIYVSIEKIKRNLAKIGNNDAKSCFYAIIYNGYYTYEEIEILKETLMPKQALIK